MNEVTLHDLMIILGEKEVALCLLRRENLALAEQVKRLQAKLNDAAPPSA